MPDAATNGAEHAEQPETIVTHWRLEVKYSGHRGQLLTLETYSAKAFKRRDRARSLLASFSKRAPQDSRKARGYQRTKTLHEQFANHVAVDVGQAEVAAPAPLVPLSCRSTCWVAALWRPNRRPVRNGKHPSFGWIN